VVGLTDPALRSIDGEARVRGRKGNLGVEDKRRLAFGANLSERGPAAGWSCRCWKGPLSVGLVLIPDN
jgi:hypothetical protein